MGQPGGIGSERRISALRIRARVVIRSDRASARGARATSADIVQPRLGARADGDRYARALREESFARRTADRLSSGISMAASNFSSRGSDRWGGHDRRIVGMDTAEMDDRIVSDLLSSGNPTVTDLDGRPANSSTTSDRCSTRILIPKSL